MNEKINKDRQAVNTYTSCYDLESMLYRMLYWANLHVGLVIISNLLDVDVI